MTQVPAGLATDSAGELLALQVSLSMAAQLCSSPPPFLPSSPVASMFMGISAPPDSYRDPLSPGALSLRDATVPLSPWRQIPIFQPHVTSPSGIFHTHGTDSSTSSSRTVLLPLVSSPLPPEPVAPFLGEAPQYHPSSTKS